MRRAAPLWLPIAAGLLGYHAFASISQLGRLRRRARGPRGWLGTMVASASHAAGEILRIPERQLTMSRDPIVAAIRRFFDLSLILVCSMMRSCSGGAPVNANEG